jgi:hypothetical protein
MLHRDLAAVVRYSARRINRILSRRYKSTLFSANTEMADVIAPVELLGIS